LQILCNTRQRAIIQPRHRNRLQNAQGIPLQPDREHFNGQTFVFSQWSTELSLDQRLCIFCRKPGQMRGVRIVPP
jgi:hypothetical protein